MNLIKSGLLISTYTFLITFLVLAFLGFIISLFKYIFVGMKPSKIDQITALEEEAQDKLRINKKIAAISVALNEYIKESNKQSFVIRKKKIKNEINKILKSKRWQHG